MKNNKGFSLVELIVVIAIMAILVGVAVPVYTSYINNAKEAKDAQFLDELSRAAQIFAAEKGLELQSIWVAPEIKEDRGIELVLKDGTVYAGEMDALYTMLGGAYTFETIDKTQEIVYREDVAQDDPSDAEGDTECQHSEKETKAATCTEDGFERCTCGYYLRKPALGHETFESRVIGNLHVFTCKHENCDFVEIVPEGNKIG
jgi:prepilin-type N-terminal cleavage/methylation domain-containing protein